MAKDFSDIFIPIIPIVIGGFILKTCTIPQQPPQIELTKLPEPPVQTQPIDQKPFGVQNTPLKEPNLAYNECTRELLSNPVGRKGFESQQKWLKECTRKKSADKT